MIDKKLRRIYKLTGFGLLFGYVVSILFFGFVAVFYDLIIGLIGCVIFSSILVWMIVASRNYGYNKERLK